MIHQAIPIKGGDLFSFHRLMYQCTTPASEVVASRPELESFGLGMCQESEPFQGGADFGTFLNVKQNLVKVSIQGITEKL